MLIRRITVLIVLVAVLCCPFAVVAEDGSASSVPAPADVTIELDGAESEEAAALPNVSCSSYAVISSETGQVLIEKNGDKRAYPASTTKIMTMALTLDAGLGMETKLTTSREAVAEIYADSTQLYLAVGEEMTVRDLLYGAEVRSANDGANVLAEGVSGSLERFAERMNDKARELGLIGTHFVNAHGLPDDEHYTTAIDLAQITRWALSVDGFAEIFSTYTYTTEATNKADARPMTTTCDILNPHQPGYYEHAVGAKLGWTVASQYTLATAAEKGGMELICVVMGDATDTALYSDTAALLDYCFANFRAVSVTPKLANTVIPVYDAAARTGDIEITPQTFTVYLHDSINESDILVLTDTPESYEATGEIAPSVQIVLKTSSEVQAAELGVFPLAYAEHPLSGYETVRTTVLDVTEQKKPLPDLLKELLWVVIPTGTLIIALLVSLFIQLFGKKTEKLTYRNKFE